MLQLKSFHVVQVLASMVLVTVCVCWLPILDDKPVKDKGNIFPPDFVFPVVTTLVSNVGFGEGRQKSGRGECAEFKNLMWAAGSR